MRKVKNRPALFELFDKAEPEEPSLDAGIGRTAASESTSAFRATLSNLARSVGGRLDSDRRPADEQRASTFAVDDRRLIVSLGRIGGLIAIALLLTVLAASFTAGRWVGWNSGLADGHKKAKESMQRAALDEIELARKSEPVDDLFAGIGTSPVQPVRMNRVAPVTTTRPKRPTLAAATPSASPWVRGYSYVVIQHFRSDARDDAEKAQAFMKDQGVECVIFGDKKRGYRLIAAKGFNRKDRTQQKIGEQFRQRIHRIGEAYFASGGRYKLEGYFATLTGSSW